VTEWFIDVCLLHKFTVGFAVIGVINGVFIQETFRVAAGDDHIMMHSKERAARLHRAKMEKLVLAGDISSDGTLDRQEFSELLTVPEVRTWLAAMELDVKDGDYLFAMMDQNHDGRLTVAELVEGVGRCKGLARSLDLMVCMQKQHELRSQVDALVRHLMVRIPDMSATPSITSRFKPIHAQTAGMLI